MFYGQFKSLVKAATWAALVLAGKIDADCNDFELAWTIQEDIEAGTAPAVQMVRSSYGLPDHATKDHI